MALKWSTVVDNQDRPKRHNIDSVQLLPFSTLYSVKRDVVYHGQKHIFVHFAGKVFRIDQVFREELVGNTRQLST